jgi:hypothetical protein
MGMRLCNKAPINIKKLEEYKPYNVNKMADDACCSDVSSHILFRVKAIKIETVCKKCSEYETQLKEVSDELSSAQMIIEILQNRLLTFMTRTHMIMIWFLWKDSVNK